MELRWMEYFFQLLIIFSKMDNQYVYKGFRELYPLTEVKNRRGWGFLSISISLDSWETCSFSGGLVFPEEFVTRRQRFASVEITPKSYYNDRGG